MRSLLIVGVMLALAGCAEQRSMRTSGNAYDDGTYDSNTYSSDYSSNSSNYNDGYGNYGTRQSYGDRYNGGTVIRRSSGYGYNGDGYQTSELTDQVIDVITDAQQQ